MGTPGSYSLQSTDQIASSARSASGSIIGDVSVFGSGAAGDFKLGPVKASQTAILYVGLAVIAAVYLLRR
jgi:hypothetical protein